MSWLLLLILATPAVSAGDAALSFMEGDKERLRVTAAELTRRPSARLVDLVDPFYRRRKRFRAVPFKELLNAAYGGSWAENTGELFFEALDGYRSHAKVATLMSDGAMLAFEDADAADWREIPGKGATPAPFYLIWTGAEQGPKQGFPWPWQLFSVKLAVLEDEYPGALPHGAASESAAARGWRLFRANCISCHAISGDGGSLGPELNEPRGITRYHDKLHLKAYIRKPSSFRRTKMPDFDELTPSELDELIAYFEHMTRLAGTR